MGEQAGDVGVTGGRARMRNGRASACLTNGSGSLPPKGLTEEPILGAIGGMEKAVPQPDEGRTMRGPDNIDAHPSGASPFGVMDLVGNVWQWTDEYVDEHTRAGVLRGGSYYKPQGSIWYFPQAYRNDNHGKLLLMAPSYDRSGALGFRCVKDLE
jgi:Sulfatase-modifying factor enzyme 1